MIDARDSQIGMMIGLAIGDAMGAPIEFTSSREPEDYVTSYLTGGVHDVSLGEFTDDTSMALAMADAFLTSKTFDPHLIMDNFLKWRNEGAYSPRGAMFDCGNTVASALICYESDKSKPFAGSTDPLSAGNGGLMRLAPAILAACELDEAVRFAARSTRLTHGADEAIFYSELLAEELWNQEPNKRHPETKHPLDIARNEVMSGGYVKETYQAAWWAFQTTDCFEDCIIKAINRGHDTDTTGAVAGMVAGAIYGYSSIPQWMLDGLQWHDKIKNIAEALIEMAEIQRETPRETLREMRDALFSFQQPNAGEIYTIKGRKCLCIHPLANYGGGSATLWAVEGHSAQLTLYREQGGYIRGKCIRVSDDPVGIEFQPNRNGWGRQDDDKEKRFLKLEEIGRYDTSWY